jgi:hypothetical protein
MKLQFVDLSEKMLLLLPPDRKNFYEISKQPATRKSNWPIFSSLSNSNAAGKVHCMICRLRYCRRFSKYQ